MRVSTSTTVATIDLVSIVCHYLSIPGLVLVLVLGTLPVLRYAAMQHIEYIHTLTYIVPVVRKFDKIRKNKFIKCNCNLLVMLILIISISLQHVA